ncbi:MAG: protease inhibitor I42 family protein [Candidatus Riflebacteria bacterium]|nr:protease inhibitor I42 family protein [Candidatus Riflebacteria bacterium]
MKKVLFFALGLALISCVAFATSMIPKEVQKDDSANGQSIQLFVGQTLSLSLSENPSTGYRWTVEEFQPKVLEQLDTVFKPGSGVGSGGSKVFGFLAKRAGESTISLAYQRPWAETVAPAKTFKIQVTVIKAGQHADEGPVVSPRPGPVMSLGKTVKEVIEALSALKGEELKATSAVEFRPATQPKEYVGLIVITDPKRLPRCPHDKLPMSNQALLTMAKALADHYGKKGQAKELAFLMGGFPQPGFVQVTLVGTGLGLYFNVATGEPMGKLTGKL